MLTSEFGEGNVMNVWRFAVRWVVPPALVVILVCGIMDKF
jgi:NSS family neurotransmitter:Na+ symporter